MVDLSHLYQCVDDSVENFVARFKRTKNKCYFDIPKYEFVKITQGGLKYKLKKI